jgi:hypothetical protein
MKNLLPLIALFLSLSAQANTLANPGDFVVVSDTSENSMGIFLSYTGKKFDHCGIKLRTSSSSGVTAQQLKEVLSIETRGQAADISKIVKESLVATTPANETKYGEFFTIKTRSGTSIRDALAAIREQKLDLIAEILSCKK